METIWYTYAFNNPLSFTDPSGWWPQNDPAENYDEPTGYAPTGGGDVYNVLPNWYNGPADPFAGMGFDFEGKLHDAYINTTTHRNREIGPGADYYMAKNFVQINGEYRYRGDASVSEGLSQVTQQASYASQGYEFQGYLCYNTKGSWERSGASYRKGSSIEHVYYDDLRIDLESDNWTIGDLFSRISYLNSIGQLDNLFDIVIPNNYANNTGYGKYYVSYFDIGDFKYKVRIKTNNDTDPKTAFQIWKLGFGHLNQGNNNYKKTAGYNNGYYTGFFMWSYEDDPLIQIGGRSNEAKLHLIKLYHKP